MNCSNVNSVQFMYIWWHFQSSVSDLKEGIGIGSFHLGRKLISLSTNLNLGVYPYEKNY